ncbi:MAG: hypothetical protein HY554_04315 [Elusimicrobia bacterium]|nr:hypothetical protein [Elusimicrobiota bacterium]
MNINKLLIACLACLGALPAAAGEGALSQAGRLAPGQSLAPVVGPVSEMPGVPRSERRAWEGRNTGALFSSLHPAECDDLRGQWRRIGSSWGLSGRISLTYSTPDVALVPYVTFSRQPGDVCRGEIWASKPPHRRGAVASGTADLTNMSGVSFDSLTSVISLIALECRIVVPDDLACRESIHRSGMAVPSTTYTFYTRLTNTPY